MHRSQLGGFIIDCQTKDLDAAARFWGEALGLKVRPSADPEDKNYAVFDTTPNGLDIQVQKVDHPSRVHLDIESDDIDAEVARLEKLGATVDERKERWVIMRAPTGQRFCIVRVQRPNWPKNANQWD